MVAAELDQNDRFRGLIADGLAEDEPDRASWLFLTRPAGWSDDLTMIVEAAAEETAQASTEARLRDVERHLVTTRAALEDARSDLARAEGRTAELQSQVGDLRSTITRGKKAVEDLRDVNRRLEDERDRAVKSLKRAEELATTRLERIRELESAVDSRADAGRDDGDDVSDREGTVDHATTEPLVDAELMTSAFRAAIGALEQLGEALGTAAVAIGLDELAVSGVEKKPWMGSDVAQYPSAIGGRSLPDDRILSRRPDQPPRRVPIRLRRGAVEGSADAIEQLLATPDVIVLVDGYNVAMEAWPGLSKATQRDSLIQMATVLASRSGADIHLVFDGVGDGTRPNVTAALPVRVHFSDAHTEADDVIIEMARIATGHVVVVTSDRRILDTTRRMGANVITSAQMIRFVRGRAAGSDTGAGSERRAGGC